MSLSGTYPAGTFRFTSQQDIYESVQGVGPATIFDFTGAASTAVAPCFLLHGAAQLRDCTVIGAGTWSVPVWLEGCQGAVVDGVTATGSGYILIVDSRGVNNKFFRCRAVDTAGIAGYAYAFGSFGSQHLRVSQCHGHSLRHAMTMSTTGPGSATTSGGGGVTYDCVVSDCTLIGEAMFGADMHGGTQRSKYLNCKIVNGVNIGGVENEVRGCDISVLTLAGQETAVNFATLGDLNHTIADCTIHGACPTATVGAIQWERVGDTPPTGGTFIFEDLTINVTGRPFNLRNHWEIGPNAVFRGTVVKPSQYRSTADGLIQSLFVPTRWAQVRMENLRYSGGNFAPGAYINDFQESNVQWSA